MSLERERLVARRVRDISELFDCESDECQRKAPGASADGGTLRGSERELIFVCSCTDCIEEGAADKL